MVHHVRLAGGERLALEFTPPMNPQDSKGPKHPKSLGGTTALYVHGLGSHRGGEKARFFEQEFCARGFGFARFDFRGHGDSDGRMAELTMSRQLEDLAAILAWLEENAASQRLLLIGASLGALTVAWQGALAPREAGPRGKLPIVGQVLLAPAFRIVDRYLAALGEFGRARWQREGIYRFVGPWFEFDLKWDVVRENERYSQDRLLHDTWRPTLILHGSVDESAPVAESVAFAQRCAGTRPHLVVLEGGDHRLTAFKERLVAETLQFMDTIGAGANACAR